MVQWVRIVQGNISYRLLGKVFHWSRYNILVLVLESIVQIFLNLLPLKLTYLPDSMILNTVFHYILLVSVKYDQSFIYLYPYL